MSGIDNTERVQVVVIGAGQAGLSVGYHLARRGVRFVILEAKARVGDSWRERWDSLRLFTTGRLDGLDGMPFPAPGHRYPTKDEMADYLEAYAARFALPVRTGVRVTGLSRQGERYLVSAGDQRFEADHVVIAMATYQEPRIPAFAAELAPEIGQLHSREYRRPSQLKPGGVLVVGAGNSGAEIALEAVQQRPSDLALGPGHRDGAIPDRQPARAPRASAAAAPGHLPSPADGGHADGP
jgi:putative flavoprotein involved in K+ transport